MSTLEANLQKPNSFMLKKFILLTKINGETVDFTNMDMKHFRIEKENEDILIYSALVHTVALNKIVKIANVQILKVGKVALTKVYFSANREIEAWEVLEIY